MYIPDMCYSLNNSTINPKIKIGKVIVIKALEKGYYPKNKEMTQEEVDEMNEKFGVTIAESRAMQTASMFG